MNKLNATLYRDLFISADIALSLKKYPNWYKDNIRKV